MFIHHTIPNIILSILNRIIIINNNNIISINNNKKNNIGIFVQSCAHFCAAPDISHQGIDNPSRILLNWEIMSSMRVNPHEFLQYCFISLQQTEESLCNPPVLHTEVEKGVKIHALSHILKSDFVLSIQLTEGFGLQ